MTIKAVHGLVELGNVLIAIAFDILELKIAIVFWSTLTLITWNEMTHEK